MATRNRLVLAIVTAGVLSALRPASANAGLAFFDATTDSIEVSGQTVIGTTSTYEAVVMFPSGTGANGSVFNEQTDSLEDKLLAIGPTGVGTTNFPATGFSVTAALTPDVFHHVAYVYDGAEARVYVDGSMVGAQTRSGAVGNGSGFAYIGLPLRSGACDSASFVGYLDSLRISDVARYSGSSFAPPVGDLPSDASTLLLYNFNGPPGSATATDSGPLGRTGTLGAGCGQATLPELISPNSCGADLFDLSQGITITANSPILSGFDIRDMFGTAFSSGEPTDTIFADGQAAGFVHFVEWQTAAPVILRSINLQASSIGSPGTREFDRVVLKAKSLGSLTFDLTLLDFTPTHPYPADSALPPYSLLSISVPAITAQEFRAEFVDRGPGGGSSGPRIVELDAFGTTVPACPVATPTPTATACDPTPTPTPADPLNLVGPAAKAAVACQKAIAKAGTSLVQEELKRTGTCARTIMKCVQTGDQSCTTGAGAKCTADLAKVAAAEAKLAASIKKKCAGLLGFTDLASGSGLGYTHLAAECSGDFGTPAGNLDGVAACVTTQHRCVSVQLLDVEAARARELMTFAGVPGASLQPFTCLPDHGGTGAGVNDPSGTGKAITKCTATLQKAATAFVKAKLGSLAKCVNSVFACRQLKPGVPCLTKASGTCDKAFTKIASATTKLVAAVDKSCTESVIAYASLRTTDAANLAVLAAECAAHGVVNLDTLANYETCLFRQHECRVEDLLRLEAPRAAELLQAVGHELRSGFCPPRPGQCTS